MNVRLYPRKGIWWASWTANRRTMRKSTRTTDSEEARAVVDGWLPLPSKKITSFVWGRVYFAEAEGTGRIKIGWSREGSLERRIAELQIGCPFRLFVLATYTGRMVEEAKEHRTFRDSWLHGEWFAATADLRGRIDRIREPTVRHPKPEQASPGATTWTSSSLLPP